MARYQIRTPDHQVLEDVIQIMADKTWGILNAWQVFKMTPKPKLFESFRKSIYLDLIPHVKTYKLCGLSNLCLDETLGAPWSDPSHVLEASPRDFVYHLFPGKGLEQFLDGLAGSAFEAIRHELKPEMADEVRSILKTAFRTILGEYLYFNPACGKTELCIYSASSQVEAWGRPRD